MDCASCGLFFCYLVRLFDICLEFCLRMILWNPAQHHLAGLRHFEGFHPLFRHKSLTSMQWKSCSPKSCFLLPCSAWQAAVHSKLSLRPFLPTRGERSKACGWCFEAAVVICCTKRDREMSASWVISGNKKIARVSQKCGAAKALQIFWLLLSLLKNNPGENGYPCYNWNLGNSACTHSMLLVKASQNS